MANDSVVTQNTLQTFYDNKVYPYLNGATHTGCVPLGTVLPYYGETAPEHFLICDGTEYLKSDYGELATHLLSLTDPTPYQGSDADHFKVPDLRGEFLRGAGTNSHTGQGSGGDVGEHQDATLHRGVLHNSYGDGRLATTGSSNLGDDNVAVDYDTIKAGGSWAVNINKSYEQTGIPSDYTSRPTNTSVTYIIAYQNAYIDLALDGFPIDITQPQDGQLLMYDATAGRWVNGGHKYSTDEHIVGTWIDEKPLYERSYYVASFNASGAALSILYIDSSFTNKTMRRLEGTFTQSGDIRKIPYHDSAAYEIIGLQTSDKIKLSFDKDWGIVTDICVTVQYTKTTD